MFLVYSLSLGPPFGPLGVWGPWVLPVRAHSSYATVIMYLRNFMTTWGILVMFDLVRARVYWPRMHSDIKHYVQNVCCCLKQKRPATTQREPLHPIETTRLPNKKQVGKNSGTKSIQ
jgi:hypothetical protein